MCNSLVEHFLTLYSSITLCSWSHPSLHVPTLSPRSLRRLTYQENARISFTAGLFSESIEPFRALSHSTARDRQGRAAATTYQRHLEDRASLHPLYGCLCSGGREDGRYPLPGMRAQFCRRTKLFGLALAMNCSKKHAFNIKV